MSPSMNISHYIAFNSFSASYRSSIIRRGPKLNDNLIKAGTAFYGLWVPIIVGRKAHGASFAPSTIPRTK